MHMIMRSMAASVVVAVSTMAVPASAQLVLNQAIVDLTPDKPRRMDIEVSNVGGERLYIVAEPFEITDPGRPTERRTTNSDPALLGLLVTPRRMILEPGERKLVRVASIAPLSGVERIYRVTIKPVAGEVSATSSALKILVGYDVLVIVRPAIMTGTVTGSRHGNSLVLTNTGTTNVEIYEGKQCNADSVTCTQLPARRLYAGATVQMTIDPAKSVQYRVKTGTVATLRRF